MGAPKASNTAAPSTPDKPCNAALPASVMPNTALLQTSLPADAMPLLLLLLLTTSPLAAAAALALLLLLLPLPGVMPAPTACTTAVPSPLELILRSP